jgi:lambda family phage tail tape measure protein
MAATGQAVLASTLAITAPIAAAQSAIWAVPATLSTIASYGASAEAAPAFVLQSLAESLGALAGFSGGGFTGLGNTSQPAGVVHGGEFVFSAPATSRLGVDNLESLHQAALSPSVNVQGHSVVNVMVRDQSELRDFLKSRAGRDEVVNIVRTYRTEIGIA